MRNPRPCQRLFAPLLLLAAALGACSSPGDDAAEDAPPPTGAELGSRNFLQFLNRQPSLAAGNYRLVAATASAGQAGSYTLSVRFDDGSTLGFTGSWTSSGGPDAEAAGNPRHEVELELPGGLVAQLDTPVDGVLYLLDASGEVVAQDDNGGGGTTARIALAASRTDDATYATAYYATIDPLDQKDTLPKWKSANGFDAGDDAAAVFLDTKDLGYGRNMHMRRGADGRVAFYVENYQIRNVPGQNYSAINLDAAVERIREFHIGTNALEFGPVDADADGTADDLDGDGDVTADRDDYVVHFYTFDATPPYARRLSVDMDGFGEKGMPVPCITCHGGRADPLLPDGSFPNGGDTRGHFQPIDVDTLGFSTKAGATRAEMEVGLKAFNCEVYRSFEPDLADRPGRWNSAMAREMLEAWYGGDPCGVATVFADAYVPSGWVHDADSGAPPAGSEALYREVIADNCRTCHLLRGTQDNPEIDFTSFERFIAHAAQIEPMVYDSGRMPLAFVPYRNLFDADGAIEQLASFLPGFSRVAADGSVLRPGRPIADAGPDRRAPSPVAVSGVASRQAERYAWRIVSQPVGSVASLESPGSVRTRLNADTDGDYELELTVTGDGPVSRDRVLVTIDEAMSPAPSALRFETDIKPLLQDGCVSCHAAGGNGVVLPPVFYTDPGPGENRDLYDEVRARIDFADPLESPLLTKPSGRHHAGGEQPGFDLEADRAAYDTILAWILEGAPRGP
jgi:hypothetical protein